MCFTEGQDIFSYLDETRISVLAVKLLADKGV